MLYRQKKATHIRKLANGALITSKDNMDEKLVDESGAVFLCALSHESQTIDELADKILKVFVGVDNETIKQDAAEFYKGLQFNRDTNLTFNDIYGKYYEMGFRNFKLLGRNEQDLLSTFESCIYYMTAPDCRDIARYDLLNFYIDYLIDEFHGDRKNALKWHEENLSKKH